MSQEIDFRNLVYSERITLVTPDEVRQERKRYSQHKLELKSLIYKYYYYSDYFSDVPLTFRDRKMLSEGFSPIDIDENSNEFFRYSIHHITPLNCGGKTVAKNLIPLPKKFHDFVHDMIITPQIDGLQYGDSKVLYGLPNFNKITLSQMQDNRFIKLFHQYVVDRYKIFPVSVSRVTRRNPKVTPEVWYRRRFGKEME